MAEQLSFDIGDTRDYIRKCFDLFEERDELNERINMARTMAKDLGVPTKAVEKAISADNARRKSMLPQADWQWILHEVEALQDARAIVTEAVDQTMEDIRAGRVRFDVQS